MRQSVETESFQCPDEATQIDTAVHLARLAAGYTACQHCPQRRQHGHLLNRVVQLGVAGSPPLASVFTRDGVRGLYANQLTRESLAEIAAAVARTLWDELNPHDPRVHRVLPGEIGPELEWRRQRRAYGLDESLPAPQVIPATSPRIVLGHDQRSSSPDLTWGVLEALRRGGCQVLNLGCSSRPELEFALQRLGAEAGVFVTGGTRPATVNGLDVLDKYGWEWTLAHDWEQIEALVQQPVTRPVRRSGSQASIRYRVEYQESLKPLWQGLRTLRLAVLSAEPLATWLLPELVAATPLQMILEHVNRPFGGQPDPPDDLADRLFAAVQGEQADVGCLIGSDGRSCYFMDERGEILLPQQVQQLLQFGKFAGTTTDDCGRYWLTANSSRCDALHTFARLLHSLSRADCRVSDWL